MDPRLFNDKNWLAVDRTAAVSETVVVASWRLFTYTENPPALPGGYVAVSADGAFSIRALASDDAALLAATLRSGIAGVLAKATQGPAFMYIIPSVGAMTSLWLGWLVLAGLLHLGSTLFGGRGSMQSALNIAAWASLPYALRDLLRTVYMLASSHTIASPGLSGFAANSTFFYQLLQNVDLFLIWNFVLLVVGFSVYDGLTRGKAFVNVLIVVLIVLLAQAGLGMIGSGLSGSAIQRPFF